MIGILIDLLEKSIFWAQLDQQKVLKLPFLFRGGPLKAPPQLVGLKRAYISLHWDGFEKSKAIRDFG